MTGHDPTSAIQEQGKRLVAGLHGALRALKFYPLENETVQQSLRELQGIVSVLAASEGEVGIRVVGDFFFVNDTRLRIDIRTFATFGSFAKVLGGHGIGTVEIGPGIGVREWAPFLSLLLRDPADTEPFEAFEVRLAQTDVQHIAVHPSTDELDESDQQALQRAKRTYAQSVKVAKDVLSDVRMGVAANVRKVKRAVQNIVDQVLADEASMVTMTTLRDFDEYTFTHCVNVAIFSVVIGQRLGLSKLQLYELGLCGLLHDIGKQRTGWEIINKEGKPTDEEWRMIRRHPTEGMLIIVEMGGFEEMPYRQILAAYEHHMRTDLAGYPENIRPRRPTLFSRIVAVADGFDAATTKRSYQYRPNPPDKILREMRDAPNRGFDRLVVKAFINATGVFPIGTLVVLSKMELAIVTEVNRDPAMLHRPKVRVITDSNGVPLDPPADIDLAAEDPATGKPFRHIVKTVDPERYRIRVSDYLM